MNILKLKAHKKDYLWGGTKLSHGYRKGMAGEKVAETWELSCHPDGLSMILNGAYAGQSLLSYIEAEGKQVLGCNCESFKDFPILVKFIDANQDLSVQVHPNDEYALENEGQLGKTEVWYVVDCEPDSYLYYGFKEDISKDEFAKRIRNNTLPEVLNRVFIQPGDVYFIAAGTVHAIGKNTLIAEIQQNSNVTYRIYDYDRKDSCGNARELHIEKALEVSNLQKMEGRETQGHTIAKCKYFTVDKVVLGGPAKEADLTITKDSFLSVLVISGAGTIEVEGEVLTYNTGDSFFVPAGHCMCQIRGDGVLLLTQIPSRDNVQAGA